MPTNVSEMNLEGMILAYLRDKQGYEEGTSNDYVKDYALDTERVKRFLLSTQKKKVENTACFANAITERKFFSELKVKIVLLALYPERNPSYSHWSFPLHIPAYLSGKQESCLRGSFHLHLSAYYFRYLFCCFNYYMYSCTQET